MKDLSILIKRLIALMLAVLLTIGIIPVYAYANDGEYDIKEVSVQKYMDTYYVGYNDNVYVATGTVIFIKYTNNLATDITVDKSITKSNVSKKHKYISSDGKVTAEIIINENEEVIAVCSAGGEYNIIEKQLYKPQYLPIDIIGQAKAASKVDDCKVFYNGRAMNYQEWFYGYEGTFIVGNFHYTENIPHDTLAYEYHNIENEYVTDSLGNIITMKANNMLSWSGLYGDDFEKTGVFGFQLPDDISEGEYTYHLVAPKTDEHLIEFFVYTDEDGKKRVSVPDYDDNLTDGWDAWHVVDAEALSYRDTYCIGVEDDIKVATGTRIKIEYLCGETTEIEVANSSNLKFKNNPNENVIYSKDGKVKAYFYSTENDEVGIRIAEVDSGYKSTKYWSDYFVDRILYKLKYATTHVPADPVKENEVEPTCETEGSYDEVTYCALCGKEISRDKKVIKAKGHVQQQAILENEKFSTCNESGSYDEVVKCSVCGKEINRKTVVVDKLGHDYGAPAYIWSEDGKKCTASVICKRNECTDSMTGHEITEDAVVSSTVKEDSTTEKKGTTTYTAVFNNKLFIAQTMNVVDIPIKEKTNNSVDEPENKPNNTESIEPAKEETMLEAVEVKAKVVVTSKKGEEPTVEYIGTTDKTAKTIKVPEKVTVGGVTYKVTEIADGAFEGNNKIEKVEISKNIIEIGENAFKGCKKLKSFSTGANVETIGTGAFANCKALTAFTMTAKVKNLGNNIFKGANKLKKITIKTNKLTTKNVSKNAFKGVNKKVTIKVPKKMKKSYTKLFRKKGLDKKVKIQ